MSQGYRTDLRDEDHYLDDREDIEYYALCHAKKDFGVTAYILARGTCSKEWARQILNRMVDDGLLFNYRCFVQLKLFRLTEAGEQKLQELTELRRTKYAKT